MTKKVILVVRYSKKTAIKKNLCILLIGSWTCTRLLSLTLLAPRMAKIANWNGGKWHVNGYHTCTSWSDGHGQYSAVVQVVRGLFPKRGILIIGTDKHNHLPHYGNVVCWLNQAGIDSAKQLKCLNYETCRMGNLG